MLVHCYMGRSRSVTLVVAYLMARKALPLRDALALVRRVRPQARPNAGFYQELVAYEDQLRDAGVIASPSLAESEDALGIVDHEALKSTLVTSEDLDNST